MVDAPDPGASVRLRSNPWLLAVLGVGLVVRAVLIPITHGQDFVVWDKASAGTLDGVNVYAHHPNYPGGPFAYFPLFIYLEVPFRWIADHGLGEFLVWGKLPILAADVACAVLIAAELRRRGRSTRVVAAGAALFFLNPLVLYNSAYYGRFDSLGCALLVAALLTFTGGGPSSRAWPFWYALAIAAKTFPAFVVIGLLRRAQGARVRLVLTAVVVVGLLTLPYLFTPRAFVHDLLVHDLTKTPQGLTWQYLLSSPLGDGGTKKLSYVLLALFLVVAIWLSGIADLWLYTAAVLTAFLVTSKLVLEQYLTWPMAFLIVVGLSARSLPARAALGVLAVFSVIGVIDNETWHPFGRESFLGVVVAVVSVAFVLVAFRGQPSEAAPKVSHLVGSPER